MNKITITLSTILSTLAVFFVFLIPMSASADVIPLVPLPTNFGTDTRSIGGYVSTLFFLTISVGAVLAVLRIIYGGFRYMVSEAVGDVKEARLIITRAIIGLVLLLASWLILYQINPDLVDLKSLEFNSLRSVITPFGSANLSGGDIGEGEQRNPNAPAPTVARGTGGNCIVVRTNDFTSRAQCYPTQSACEAEVQRRIETRNSEGATLTCEADQGE